MPSVALARCNMDLSVAIGTSAASGLSVYKIERAATPAVPALYFGSSAVVINFGLLDQGLPTKPPHPLR
jgi:cation transport ATPase